MSRLFDDPPLLHTWDGGVTWNTGGFSAHDLRWLRDLVWDAPGLRLLETGAGNSTLAFLAAGATRLVTIVPDDELVSRIRDAAAELDIPAAPLEAHVDRSELVLPRLLEAGQRFDLALLDGGHGWPTVFVDFCFANAMLEPGGILILDDLQLHSIGELARLITRQPGFEYISGAPSQKTIAIRKMTGEAFLPDWGGQPYIVERSADATFGYDNYDLGPR